MSRQQHLMFDQSASIIAPGREGSQLGGADTPRPVGIRKISWALALLPHEGISRRQYLPAMAESASIIAPGSAGSQLPAPPPKLVSTQTANGGGEGQPLAA